MYLCSLQYEDGGTALTIACRRGDVQTTLVLLAHGAVVDSPDKVRTTFLSHYIIMTARSFTAWSDASAPCCSRWPYTNSQDPAGE